MGIRFRKSINLGHGFRVNISSSGIGYSWGTRGYRYTRTASGRTRSTFSIPGTGISYVSESGGRRNRAEAVNGSVRQQEYEDLEQIRDTDPDELRSEVFNELFRKIRLNKKLNVAFIVGTFVFLGSLPPLAVIFAIGLIYIHTKGRCRIEYNFDEGKKAEWDSLSAAWRNVSESDVLRQIIATAKPKNKKTTFGVNSLNGCKKVTAGDKLPHFIRTNVRPVVFELKNCRMAVLPDRLFLFGKHGKYGAIDYRDVYYEFSAVGFVEIEKPPCDSEFVRNAWKYTNKDGSPDKRYKGNKAYPMFKYGEIEIKSTDGQIDTRLLCSNERAAESLAKAIGNRAHIK